jgi:hypothetical protein
MICGGRSVATIPARVAAGLDESDAFGGDPAEWKDECCGTGPANCICEIAEPILRPLRRSVLHRIQDPAHGGPAWSRGQLVLNIAIDEPFRDFERQPLLSIS